MALTGNYISEAARFGEKLPSKGIWVPEYLKRVGDKELLDELCRRNLSSVDVQDVPDRALWSEIGRRRQAQRKVHRGGPGRPASPRCICGRFTKSMARKKDHRCPPEAWGESNRAHWPGADGRVAQ
jgi:hypothetical protein